MSHLVRNQWPYFRLFVSDITDIQRQGLLETITKEQLKALVQIVVNFLRGVLTAKPATLSTLEKHKSLFRRLADDQIPIRSKKKLLRKRQEAVTKLLKAVTPSLKAYLR